MAKTYLAAYTPGEGYTYYPPFINISRDDTTGEIVVILRANENASGGCGDQVEARFNHTQFAVFLGQAVTAAIGSLGGTVDGLRAAMAACADRSRRLDTIPGEERTASGNG